MIKFAGDDKVEGFTAKSRDTAERREPGDDLAYVLITPARNEASYIELTIKSVIAQTILPIRWVIVSDGSTDATDDIVGKYAAQYEWIELVRMPVRSERHFAGKVHAFNAGYEKLVDLKYDIIGNIDADISFGRDHMEFLLDRFAEHPMLGVGGTADVEGGRVTYDYKVVNIEDISGACQLFRRECFEQIGGYIPIKGGGIDWTAVNTARMKGWKTRTFEERVYIHHRERGSGQGGRVASFFRAGMEDYYLGGHPMWEALRTFYQMKYEPYVLGGVFLLCGYIWAFLSRMERPIPQELIEFRRNEQLQRLRNLLRTVFR